MVINNAKECYGGGDWRFVSVHFISLEKEQAMYFQISAVQCDSWWSSGKILCSCRGLGSNPRQLTQPLKR